METIKVLRELIEVFEEKAMKAKTYNESCTYNDAIKDINKKIDKIKEQI